MFPFLADHCMLHFTIAFKVFRWLFYLFNIICFTVKIKEVVSSLEISLRLSYMGFFSFYNEITGILKTIEHHLLVIAIARLSYVTYFRWEVQ